MVGAKFVAEGEDDFSIAIDEDRVVGIVKGWERKHYILFLIVDGYDIIIKYIIR